MVDIQRAVLVNCDFTINYCHLSPLQKAEAVVAEDAVTPMRKPSTSVDESEDVAASPASSVLSAEQAPVPSKPVTVSSKAARCMHWLSVVFLFLVY